jgi:TPR repeat
LENDHMKLSTLCIVALLCLALAGQASAQTTADSYRKAGAAYFKAGQFRESVKAYQQVIRLKPNDTDAYQQLGEAFSRLGMNKEAAEAFEKSADLLTSGNGAPSAAPTPAVTQSAQNTTPRAQRQPSAAIGQLKHKVGDRVDYVNNGVWYKAIIIKVRDDSAEHLDHKLYSPYRIHMLGYNEHMDTWVCCADFTDFRSQLRPAGAGPTEPVPGGEANDEVLKAMRGDPNSAVTPSPAFGYVGRTTPVAKQYHCVYFSGNQLVDAAPVTITGDSTYTDSEGKRGTFSYAAPNLIFHGGNYDGQRAEYETSGGLPQLHILGPSGRRVIDCD